MEVDQDSSLLSVDISENTENSRLNCSNIHKYCREPKDDEATHDAKGNKKYYCKICSWSGLFTTNVQIHLRKKHDIDCPA